MRPPQTPWTKEHGLRCLVRAKASARQQPEDRAAKSRANRRRQETAGRQNHSPPEPCDPETRDIAGYRNANRAPSFRERDTWPHPDCAGAYQKRARGGPRLAKDKAVHAKFQKTKSRKPVERSSAQSGSATYPALVSVIGLSAEASGSGARPSAARVSLMVSMPFVA